MRSAAVMAEGHTMKQVTARATTYPTVRRPRCTERLCGDAIAVEVDEDI